MFDNYDRKYITIFYADDTGTDDGADFDRKNEAESYMQRKIREDGWQTAVCINTRKKRIELILGEPQSVLKWFVPDAAEILRENTTGIPRYMYE